MMQARDRPWLGAIAIAIAIAITGCIQGELDLPEFHLTEWPDDPTVASLSSAATVDGSSPSATSPTSADDTSSSDDGPDDTSTGEPQPSVCDPQPADIRTDVIVDSLLPWQHEPVDLVAACVTTWVGNVGTALHLGLACDDGPHTLDVTDVGPIDLEPGDLVELALSIDRLWWTNIHVVLRREGAVVLAASAADALPPHDFFAPLTLAVLTQVCDVEPPAPCEDLCVPQCTTQRRHAIVFLDEAGDTEVVYDRGAGQLGGLAIQVGLAVEHAEAGCTDVPGSWYGFVAVGG